MSTRLLVPNPFTVANYRFEIEANTKLLPRYLHPQVRKALRVGLEVIPKRELKSRLGSVATLMISVRFVSDRQMKHLNMRYRGRDKTTDILSFSQIERPSPKLYSTSVTILGDLVISFPQLSRQASLYRNGMKAELSRLLVHGVLHLVGFDHQTPDQAKVMFRLQNRAVYSLMAAIGSNLAALTAG